MSQRFSPLFALFFCLLLSLPVWAEGPLSGGTRIYLSKEPFGPFTLTSFAAPNPPVTSDNLWITLQVRDGARAVTDAQLWVHVVAPDGSVGERVEATHELAASALDYTAVVPVTIPGRYEVQVELQHSQGEGSLSYPIEVNEPLTGYIFLMMGIPFLLLGLYLVYYFIKKEKVPS